MTEQEQAMEMVEKFTEEDLDNCWQYHKAYLIDILNGDYDLNDAREDLRGLIGTVFDKRTEPSKTTNVLTNKQ